MRHKDLLTVGGEPAFTQDARNAIDKCLRVRQALKTDIEGC